MKDDSTLIEAIEGVRDETRARQNTAFRVGSLLKTLWEWVKECFVASGSSATLDSLTMDGTLTVGGSATIGGNMTVRGIAAVQGLRIGNAVLGTEERDGLDITMEGDPLMDAIIGSDTGVSISYGSDVQPSNIDGSF